MSLACGRGAGRVGLVRRCAGVGTCCCCFGCCWSLSWLARAPTRRPGAAGGGSTGLGRRCGCGCCWGRFRIDCGGGGPSDNCAGVCLSRRSFSAFCLAASDRCRRRFRRGSELASASASRWRRFKRLWPALAKLVASPLVLALSFSGELVVVAPELSNSRPSQRRCQTIRHK